MHARVQLDSSGSVLHQPPCANIGCAVHNAAGVQASYNRNTGTTSGAEANRKANEAAEEASDKLQSYAEDIQVRLAFGSGSTSIFTLLTMRAGCCLQHNV